MLPLDLLSALLNDPPQLSLLDDPAAWAAIRENAARHGVGPLVAFLARSHFAAGPEREWCDRVLTTSWRRHMRSLADQETILQVLDHAEVPLLVLKGPVLALRYYHPPFLRKPSMDIDLAVKRVDLDRAIAALAKEGYAEEWPLTEALARSHHFEMTHPSRPGVELHFRLSHGSYGIPVEEFFDRAISYTLPGGREVHVLSPADEILHLVLHRAHGRFATLFHFYEIRRLWKQATPAIRDEALQRAADHHFSGAFLLTDAGFRARWKEPLLATSATHRTWLDWRIDERLYLQFEQLSDPGRSLPLGARLARRWLDLQLTDHPADAARFISRMLRVAWFQLHRSGWKTVHVKTP